METKKIGIASDHAGYEMKEFLIGYLESKGYEVYDFGAPSAESFDYPDSAHPLACAVEKGELPMGIALCGSGNGSINTRVSVRPSAGRPNWPSSPAGTTMPISVRCRRVS